MPSLRRLDPRAHLAVAVGGAVALVVLVVALAAALLASRQADRRTREDAQEALAEIATQVRDALSLSIEARYAVLRAAAAQVARSPDRRAAWPGDLAATVAQFPEFAALGLYDRQGRELVRVGDTGHTPAPAPALLAQALASGDARPMVSDELVRARAATGVDAGAATSGARGVLDLAAPLPGPGDPVASREGRRPAEAAVLAGQLDWQWMRRTVDRMQTALSPFRRTELILVARDGRVLIGPPDWAGRRLDLAPTAAGDLPVADAAGLTEQARWLVAARRELKLAGGLGFGWTVVARQPAELALAEVRHTRATVFLTVGVAGLAAAALAALLTRLLLRRLGLLAREAEAVMSGTAQSLGVPPGRDEVSRIAATLAQLVARLQADKAALQNLATELDGRVAERTARIERMAADARLAAVTRERLRLARDLHDTLAHSLMALLTQVRLVRKLAPRLDADALDEELARAEGAASEGLAGARAAIGQMRDDGVRELGLVAALGDRVRRMQERCSVELEAELDPLLADWTDERAQTLMRIVEEALRNVERHAGDCRAWLRLRVEAAGPGQRRVRVEVGDDGRGFDPALPVPGHFGLRGMREQAALIGAGFVVDSAPGRGTRVCLTVDVGPA